MMVFVLGDGYIMDTAGVYVSDGRNNDAKILEHISRRGDLDQFLARGDAVIVDRGFRDVQGMLVDEGYTVHMPQLLQGTGRQQFTTAQANASRRVTESRWVVEAAFGRLNNVFRFFAVTVESPYKPSIKKFFQISAAILNAFYPKILQDNDTHSRRAQTILRRLEIENLLRERLEMMGYLGTQLRNVIWTKANPGMFLDFPKLSWTQLEDVTLGM